MTTHNPQTSEQQLQELLRDSEATLPADIEQRLDGARRQAFATADAKPSKRRPTLWPALSAAAASVTLAAILILPDLNTNTYVATETNGEYSLNGEDDLYQNLDFYQWLAESELNNQG